MHDGTDDVLRRRLQNFREDPDDQLWNRIRVRLSDDIIKDQLSPYKEEPDELVWNSIQSTLAGDKLTDRYVSLNRIATGLTIVMLLFIFYHFGYQENNALKAINEIESSHDKKLPEKPNEVNSYSTKKKYSGNSAQNRDKLAQQYISRKETQNIQATDLGTADNIIDKSPHDGLSTSDSAAENNTPLLIARDKKNVSNQPENILAISDSIINIIDSASVAKSIEILKNDSIDVTKKEKIKMGKNSGFYFLVMPTFGYQEINPLKNDNILITSLQRISAFSIGRLGVRAEVGWERKFSSHLTMAFGVLYYQRKQTIAYNFIDSSQPSLVPSETLPLTFITQPHQSTSTFEYELKNVGILAGVNYELRAETVSHKIGLGAELHKGFSKTDVALPAASSLYFFGNAYYRASYRLSDRVDLIFQPTFNYSLKVADQLNAPFYVKPYGLGLSIGAYFKLGSQ